MNKIWDRFLVSAMVCGVMALNSAILSLADNVVTVSSLPSSASVYTASVSDSKASVSTGIEPGSEYTSGKETTPIITAAVDAQTAASVTAQSAATVSATEYSKVTVPVINAVGTIEASDVKVADAGEEKPAAVSTEKIGIVDATLENISLGSQAVAASEVGYCVILSSSPTGLMTDIKG